MIRETYVCMCDGNTIEYGWCYKESHDTEDVIYDEVIGRTTNKQEVDDWMKCNSL